MSLNPTDAHSRSPSPAPSHLHQHVHEHSTSTPGLHPTSAPSHTPSPSASPAMLPQGLGVRDVDWNPLPETHDHQPQGVHPHDRYRLTGRKGYNSLPHHSPRQSRDTSPAHSHHSYSRSTESKTHFHKEPGLQPPSPPEHLTPCLPPALSAQHHGGLGGRKGYNATPEAFPISPVEVSDPSPLRPRDHSVGYMSGRKGYNSTPRSLSPRSNP